MDIIMKKIKKFIYYYASFKQVMKDKQFIREIEKKMFGWIVKIVC